ncbi:MAG: zinc ribbon domain-containing protein [Firmicutes bacterium]|nr:zinc ribbon domain-containing protein [Bacillota bacterium]
MPTYDYTCGKCGKFEHFQRITEPPLTACPHCGGTVQRLISVNPNIIFKGPGFYVTDHRKPEYKKKAKAEKETAEAGTGGHGKTPAKEQKVS